MKAAFLVLSTLVSAPAFAANISCTLEDGTRIEVTRTTAAVALFEKDALGEETASNLDVCAYKKAARSVQVSTNTIEMYGATVICKAAGQAVAKQSITIVPFYSEGQIVTVEADGSKTVTALTNCQNVQ